MHNIAYDFSTFINIFDNIKDNCAVTSSDLADLKNELNRFLKDSTCKEIIYTTNTDKKFFGLKVVPMIDADEIFDYLIDTEPHRIDKYIVEFDSHLFNPITNLSSNELLAVLLYEVSRLVGDSQPIESARNDLNTYLAGNKDYIRVTKSIHYKEIISYGLKDYLSKYNSLFFTNDVSDIYSNEFIRSYGFNQSIETAFNTIKDNKIKLYENVELSKFIVFGWTLNLYKNLKTRRIGALHTLDRAKLLTGSRLEKMEIDNVIRRINRIDDDALLESSGVMNNIRLKIKDKLKKARLNNLRNIDNTFYELSMQVKNVEDEEDALYLMRQINNNLAVIDEYKNSKDCDEYELNKWIQLMDKFNDLRDKLISSVVYKNKTYGLFVNYPEIVENRY